MKKIQILIVVVTFILLATTVRGIGGGPTEHLTNPDPSYQELDVDITPSGANTCINITFDKNCSANVTFQWYNYSVGDWGRWEDYGYLENYKTTGQVCFWNENITCATENFWSEYFHWRVMANFTCNGIDSQEIAYLWFNPEDCPLFYIYPAWNATNVCPCCDSICIGANNENGNNMNITVYGSYNGIDYFTWNKYYNITNGTYCFCMDDVYLERTPSKQGEWISASGIQAAGAKVATMTKLGCSAAWEFSDNQEEEIQFNVRIPVRINLTLPITLDFGWSSPATNKVCNWNLSYDITALNEDTAAGCEYYQDELVWSSTTANGLTMHRYYITEIVDGDRCIHFNLERDGNDPNDNLTDDAHLHGVCFSYYYCNDLIHIYNATSPMRYNTTYYWYANITDVENGNYNVTEIFNFSTAQNHTDCFCGNITEYLETNFGEKDYIIGIIGIIGILGLIGWFMRRNED